MGSRFGIRCVDDYELKRDVCSYGYFLLAPNVWDPTKATLTRTLDVGEGPVRLVIGQPGGRGREVRVVADRAMGRGEIAEAKRRLVRMLRVDDDVSAFHRVDPRWKKSGRGRLFRSATFFEDVIRTVTNCNITWPGTMLINERLCEVINPAFPAAEQLARRRPASLRQRCKVGYRDARIVELAKLFAGGDVDVGWFEDAGTGDDEVEKELRSWPGIGPYAAANIMQLLGRYSRIALDTESVRHGRMVLGMEGESGSIMKRLAKHYEPFGAHKFRSYWFELWDFYEAKKGSAWEWEPRTTGRSFTKAQMDHKKR